MSNRAAQSSAGLILGTLKGDHARPASFLRERVRTGPEARRAECETRKKGMELEHASTHLVCRSGRPEAFEHVGHRVCRIELARGKMKSVLRRSLGAIWEKGKQKLRLRLKDLLPASIERQYPTIG